MMTERKAINLFLGCILACKFAFLDFGSLRYRYGDWNAFLSCWTTVLRFERMSSEASVENIASLRTAVISNPSGSSCSEETPSWLREWGKSMWWYLMNEGTRGVVNATFFYIGGHCRRKLAIYHRQVPISLMSLISLLLWLWGFKRGRNSACFRMEDRRRYERILSVWRRGQFWHVRSTLPKMRCSTLLQILMDISKRWFLTTDMTSSSDPYIT